MFFASTDPSKASFFDPDEEDEEMVPGKAAEEHEMKPPTDLLENVPGPNSHYPLSKVVGTPEISLRGYQHSLTKAFQDAEERKSSSQSNWTRQ